MAENRLSQVSGHLTNTYGRGLLHGEVAIITGEHGLGLGSVLGLLLGCPSYIAD